MKMNPVNAAAMILCALAFCGCLRTPDTRYYTLDMVPSGAAKPGVHLKIVRVQTLESLSRTEILIQMSPTQLEYYAEDTWSASLQELVAEKMRAELGEKTDGQKSYDLTVKLHAFQQVDTPTGADALVKLSAQVREPGASLYAVPLFERDYEFRMPAESADANAVVLALGKCLEEITANIAADTQSLAN